MSYICLTFVPSWKEIWIVHHFQGNDLKCKPILLSNLKVDYITHNVDTERFVMHQGL